MTHSAVEPYTGSMVYVAPLRGINVGGKAMVSMAGLKACFETLGLADVKTYINSGNVIFREPEKSTETLTKQIESALQTAFKLDIKVLLKTHDEFKSLVAQIPETWENDSGTKCDVMFLWPAVDSPDVLEKLPINSEIEEIRYVPGAVLWRIERAKATKSRVTRIIGTNLYKQITIRNANTVRKLLTLTSELA